jgi:hypothetical protein
MRAVVCEQLGDPTLPLGSGVLRLSENTPAPEIKPGQQQQENHHICCCGLIAAAQSAFNHVPSYSAAVDV